MKNIAIKTGLTSVLIALIWNISIAQSQRNNPQDRYKSNKSYSSSCSKAEYSRANTTPVRANTTYKYSKATPVRANTTIVVAPTPTIHVNVERHKHRPHSVRNVSIPNAMHPSEFEYLYNDIRNITFDRDRLNAMLHAVRYNYFTSLQICELVSLLSFDNSRIIVAKEAYHKTIDPTYYYRVIDALVFSSSKREVEAYIHHNPYPYCHTYSCR